MTDRKAEDPPGSDVRAVLASLARLGDKRIREEMEPRYGIRTDKAVPR